MSRRIPSTLREWWFGAVPEDFRAVPLKHLCERYSLYGANIPAEMYESDGVRFLRTTDIGEDGALSSEGVFVPRELVAESVLAEGDFLISRSGTVGRAYVYRKIDGPCSYAGYLVRYVLNDTRSARWLFYVTKSAQFAVWLSASAIEATIGNVNGEKYANLVLPVPPLEYRLAIADLLDYETARIDALVSAKQRVLDLLAEKRKAIISTAVTRGLDSKVMLRDSGVPWLGTVPAHWGVTRLKFHLNGIAQGWSPQCEAIPAGPEDWGVLKTGCVNGDKFDAEENKRLPDHEIPSPDIEVRPRDVVMSRANTTELVGSAAIVPVDVRPRLMLSDKLYRLNVRVDELLPELLVYFLRTPSGRYDFERTASGASNSMQNISQDSVRNLWLPVPPLVEQRAIAEHIAREIEKIDVLRAAIERTIALLRERRAALIASAVTGQLDLAAAA